MSRSRPRRAKSRAAPERAAAAALASQTPRGTAQGVSPRPSAAAPSPKARNGRAMRRACHTAASRPVSSRPPLTAAAIRSDLRNGASIRSAGTDTSTDQPVPGTEACAARTGTPSCEVEEKGVSPAAMAATEAAGAGRPTGRSGSMLRDNSVPRPSTRTALQPGARRWSTSTRCSVSARNPIVRS
jgi:hypothetical protein